MTVNFYHVPAVDMAFIIIQVATDVIHKPILLFSRLQSLFTGLMLITVQQSVAAGYRWVSSANIENSLNYVFRVTVHL